MGVSQKPTPIVMGVPTHDELETLKNIWLVVWKPRIPKPPRGVAGRTDLGKV